MNDIITSSAIITPAHDLQTALFSDFVAFIDRGEKTTKTYITNFRQFVAWLAYKGISRPTRADIILYRDYLTTEHDAIKAEADCWSYRTDANGRPYKTTCSANTVKQYLQSVRQFFTWTAANGYYPNIAANIHAPKTRTDVHRKDALTPADVLTIEQSITSEAEQKRNAAAVSTKDRAGRTDRATEQGKRLFALYTLAVNAGLRTIELSRAKVKDLEYKNGRAVLYVWGKGHAEADAKKPLAPAVYDALADYLAARADGARANSPLFVSTGNRSGGQRIAPTTISKMLKRAFIAAGYNSERITAHTLRHTAGTNVQELTGNLYLTQRYMRHANPATTEIYLHNDTERAESETAELLYNLYHGNTSETPLKQCAGENAETPHGKRTETAAGADAERQRLANMLFTLSAEQIKNLASVAAAM